MNVRPRASAGGPDGADFLSARDLITFVPDRPGHDRRYAIDAGKIESELGWQPAHDFASGLVETIDWYLGNRSWWEKIRSGAYREYYQQHYGPGGRYAPDDEVDTS